MTDITCISDLHGFFPELPGGDLLIVAGDLTARDAPSEYNEFARWMRRLNYKKRIVIAGNHDNWIIESANLGILESSEIGEFEYLCDSGTTFDGLKIWGSPWTQKFADMNPSCMAFTCDTEEELAEKWALIPEDVDILITHGPPIGILDQITYWHGGIKHVGSESLHELLYKEKIKPKLHVFGHIHEGYGKVDYLMDIPHAKFINASHVNEQYKPVNKPIRIEI